ncbi:ABC transporter ATP-binding protein [Staphylococcus epidermidis]|uniref:ABC transporter ATP-binding protein n=1 Tax=Staphylococcus epidermidis TaxID=1282 RepID=UPI00026BFA16|nr:ATP-binding cassette domain-containing protein [Staphylococcus epidermidis]EJE19258.1 ABC transporter, ATP-binding protein [Staphylococcus epidermidis NIHLM008]MDU5016960.1 ATP-binding cassette domain-containing protein [Corynebacterium sp.]
MSILNVNHLSKRIKNKIILENMSFSLDKGHIVGLVGANGAGKTSLMKVILGYSDYQKGNFTTISKDKNHCNIGALIENPGLYPFMSGYDNLKLLNESNNTDSINQIVDNLKMNKYIHSKVKTYSLGMKQKLGIAIAFLNDPKLIILDEPMNGLDPKAVRDVRQLILDKAKEGSTFLISSHILSELVKITDSTLIIDEGKIIQEVTREELEQNEDQDLENLLLDIIDKEE